MDTKRKNMFVISSSRVVCFHDDFYCIGVDASKVASGIDDPTEMKTIQPDVCWNPGVCVSKKIFYTAVSSTKEKMIKHNQDVMCYPVVDPKTDAHEQV